MIDHLIPFNNEDDEGRPKNVGIRIVTTEIGFSETRARIRISRCDRAGHAGSGLADPPDGSFGWLGPYGSQVWINPKQQLVTILMIQNSVNAVQRDFEAAVVQARLNQ